MLQNAYLVAKIGADTAENERKFAEICQKLATILRIHDQPDAGSTRAEAADASTTASDGGKREDDGSGRDVHSPEGGGEGGYLPYQSRLFSSFFFFSKPIFAIT